MIVSRPLPTVVGESVRVSWTVASAISILHGWPPLAADRILAFPLMNSILFFFIRNSTPLLSFEATSRERPMTLAQSKETFPSIFSP